MEDIGIFPRTPQKGDIVKAITSRGIARAKGWATPVIQGEVLALTEKAILVKGHADVYDDDTCMICGITLKKFTSRFTHVGPVCSKQNGLFYPTDTELTDEQRQEIRDRIRATWEGEAWMPRAWTRFTVLEEAPSHTGPDDSNRVPAHDTPENTPGPRDSISKFDTNTHSQHQIAREDVNPAPTVEKIDVRFSIETLHTTKSQGAYIVCRSQFAHKDRCTSVSPRHWDAEIAPFPPSFPRPGAWCYPVSPVLAHQLKAAFEGVASRRGTPQFAELLKHSQVMEEAREIKDQDGADLPDIPVTKTRPWNHQAKSFWYAVKLLGPLPGQENV